MRAIGLLSVGSLLATAVVAEFEGNLNYASPSRRHVRLGIDVPLVARRAWKRGNVPHDPSNLRFTHGVASGDPWANSVILWTRIAPLSQSDDSTAVVDGTAPLYNHETEKYIKADPNPICVEWDVYESKPRNGKGKSVARGKAYTTSDIDYTVKVRLLPHSAGSLTHHQWQVEATGLKPLTTYYYQFTVCSSDNKSDLGRTKTAPEEDDDVSELSFAVFSCSNYPNGYFNVYGNAARKDQHDYVIHLGDYIYEMGKDGERATAPADTIFTLHDYRTRHGQYRTDPDLQLLSKNFAWLPTWDDHEFADNGYRDGFSGLNNTEESFLTDGPRVTVDTRKVNAVRAYFEWMPIRESKERGATWRLIGNQIIFSRITEDHDGTVVLPSDNWSGYIANRNRTLQHLYDNDIGNNIFLAGDSHQNWVSDLVWLGTKDYDNKTGAGSIGVEFAGTAVSSSGVDGPIEPNSGDAARSRVEGNPELMWQEGYYRGYFRLDVTPKKISAQFFGSPSVASRNAWDIPLANFTVVSGENHLQRPVAGGRVEAGALRYGRVEHTNLTLDTETGEWDVVGFSSMYLDTA
ncbi:hypothetical protein ACJ41O_011082 [Fusarium nematophilum]